MHVHDYSMHIHDYVLAVVVIGVDARRLLLRAHQLQVGIAVLDLWYDIHAVHMQCTCGMHAVDM